MINYFVKDSNWCTSVDIVGYFKLNISVIIIYQQLSTFYESKYVLYIVKFSTKHALPYKKTYISIYIVLHEVRLSFH